MEIDTKEFILQRTFALLLAKGYDGVSISDIQKETGMARGLLYHYFGGKDALFLAAVEKYMMMSLDTNMTLVKSFHLSDMITYIINKYLKISTNEWADFPMDKGITVVNYDFLIYRFVQESDLFKERINTLMEKEKQAWKIAAQNSIQAQEIRPGITAELIASFMECITNGVWLQFINDYSADNVLIEHLKEMLESYYHLIKA